VPDAAPADPVEAAGADRPVPPAPGTDGKARATIEPELLTADQGVTR